MKENNKEIIGGIYTGVSERFQRGVMKDMSRSLKANIHDSGVVEKIVFEERTDEGVRTFKDNICGTIRTIDSGWDKRVAELNRLGNIYGEDKGTGYAGNVWDKEGLCPTLTTMEGGNREPKILQIGNINPNETGQSGNVYNPNGISPTLDTCQGGNRMPKITEPTIVRSIGRNPDNPSDRTAGSPMEQRLEPNSEGICNTITTVQKDCLVLERRKESIVKGKKYGRLTVLYETEEKQGTNKIWMCKCDCGSVVKVNTGRLGKTTFSCGCYRTDKIRTHNMSNTRIYNIWILMKRRCNNPNVSGYENYGGRGIKVCDEWEEFEPFYSWAMDNGYSDDLSIDRVDNDGDYNPSNCRWATNTEQVNNRRNYGETEYYGIVRDNTGYRAQVAVNGKKVYIAHSVDDIEFLVNERNKYIDKHNLPNKKNLLEPTVKIKQATKEGYIECKVGGVADLSYPTSKTRRGRVQDNGDTSPTITATETSVHKIESPYRIRKLTPLECWRLMGFSDKDFHEAEKVNSNSQLYKQAGNSIVVDVLEGIFKQMM